jgi:hypothetical protein
MAAKRGTRASTRAPTNGTMAAATTAAVGHDAKACALRKWGNTMHAATTAAACETTTPRRIAVAPSGSITSASTMAAT